MARPTKQGVDYFPVDCQWDDKIELLIAEKGALSIAVLVTVWQLVYQNDGYFIQYSQDLFLLIKRRLMVEPEEIQEIIDSAIKRNIFDKEIFTKYNILTSRAIQKRYFIAAKKKKEISIVENYLCKGVSAPENSTSSKIDSAGNTTKEEVEVEEEEEVKENSVAGSDDRELHLAIATYLKKIVTTKKNINIDGNKLNGWANSIRLLVDRDGVSVDRIRTALVWLKDHAGDDYVPAIESGKALREKFLRLEDAMNREKKSGKVITLSKAGQQTAAAAQEFINEGRR